MICCVINVFQVWRYIYAIHNRSWRTELRSKIWWYNYKMRKIKQKVKSESESEPFPTSSRWRCIEFDPPSLTSPSVPRVQIEKRAHGADVGRKTCSNSWDWSVVPCRTCRVATPTQNFALWHGAQNPPRVYPDESRGNSRSSDDETHQRPRWTEKWDCGVVMSKREVFRKDIVESCI